MTSLLCLILLLNKFTKPIQSIVDSFDYAANQDLDYLLNFVTKLRAQINLAPP